MAQDIEIDLDADTPAPKKVKASSVEPVIELDELRSTAVATVEIDITQPSLIQAEASNVVTSNEIPNERDLLMQLVGQVQAAKAISQFSQTIGVSRLAHVKESKAYKALKGKTSNGLELSGTWVEFCNLIGISDEKANQDIANLKLFGEEALESMNQMGIGYRDLAQYRKLPVDQRTALIAAAETGDKNQFLDLAETIIERHAAEKSEQSAQIENLTQDLELSAKRGKNLDAEVERLELQNERLTNKQRLTKFEPHTEDVRLECMHLQAGVELNLNSIQTLFSLVMTEPTSLEQQLRLEHIYIAATIAASRALDLVNAIKAYDLELPDRILGQHVLTAEEAERWQVDFKSLENAQAAGEAARQIKRDTDRPRGRGRPSKSQGD